MTDQKIYPGAVLADDSSLEKFPKKIFHVRKLYIRSMGYPKKQDPNAHYHLHSLKDFPAKLPSLQNIHFSKSIIPNLEDLTAQMPKLLNISFSGCTIHNLRGIPSNIDLVFNDSTINSFEGLELPIPHNEKEEKISLTRCIIRSLAGVSKPTLHAILIQFPKYRFPAKNYVYYYKNKYYEFDNEVNRIKQIKEIVYNKNQPPLTPNMPPDSLMKTLNKISINKGIHNYFEPIFLNIPKTAMELIEQTKNPNPDNEITLDNQMRSVLNDFPEIDQNDLEECQNACEHFGVRFSINVFSEDEKIIIHSRDCFIPENLERLYQYYRKTARQLAQKYITAPEKLLADQIDRLIHEVDPELRKILENNLPPSDPVISQISAKFTFESVNELKIFK
ncbi:hypothetical protein ES705_20199 [subsurface metagenome]